jgi:hypothetical protein
MLMAIHSRTSKELYQASQVFTAKASPAYTLDLKPGILARAGVF